MTRPDFVIALVGAVGSLLPEASTNLKVELERYGYHPVIAAVTFIEAYPKSFAEAFHGDSLSVDRAAPGRLLVHAFEGVAPRAYPALFAWRKRRDDDAGRAVGLAPLSSRPWFTLADFLSDREVEQRERALVADTAARLQGVFHLDKAKASLVPEMPRPVVKAGRGTEPASQAPPSSGARQTG